MIHEGEGSVCATRAGVRNIPEPIVDPIAIIVMSNRDRSRFSSAI
jgi:hypothetical protein